MSMRSKDTSPSRLEPIEEFEEIPVQLPQSKSAMKSHALLSQVSLRSRKNGGGKSTIEQPYHSVSHARIPVQKQKRTTMSERKNNIEAKSLSPSSQGILNIKLHRADSDPGGNESQDDNPYDQDDGRNKRASLPSLSASPAQQAIQKRKYNNARLSSQLAQSQEQLASFDQRRNMSNARLKGILGGKELSDASDDGENSTGKSVHIKSYQNLSGKVIDAPVRRKPVKGSIQKRHPENDRVNGLIQQALKATNSKTTIQSHRGPASAIEDYSEMLQEAISVNRNLPVMSTQAAVGPGGTRKMMNRKLVQAKKDTEKNTTVLASRIQLLDSEETKMQRKIEQTRRLAEKIAIAQERSEEKVQFMQKLDEQRDNEKRDNMIRVQEERRRAKEALERSRKDQLTQMLHESLAAKQEKLRALEEAGIAREAIEHEKLQQAEMIREQKIEGLVKKEQNSRFYKLQEEIEKEQEEQAYQNQQELEMAMKKFKRLEGKEVHAIEKLKVTQTTHSHMQFELEKALEVSQEAAERRKEYRKQRLEQQQAEIPKIKRVVKIDSNSKQSWNTNDGGTSSSQPPSIKGARQSSHGRSAGNLSMNLSAIKQDQLIEQLREQHKKIVAEGRQRLIGNLMKHSVAEVSKRKQYPLNNAYASEDQQSLRTIQKLKQKDVFDDAATDKSN